LNASHRQLPASFEAGDGVGAQQQQGDDDQEKTDKTHQNGHAIP